MPSPVSIALRCSLRVIFHGLTWYRTRPPKNFSHPLAEKELRDLLSKRHFKVLTSERIKDPARSSYIYVEFIKAAKIL